MKRKGFLESRAARGLALLIFLGCVGLLAWLHRDDLLPAPPEDRRAADDPVALCLAERSPAIDRMVGDGLIDEARASLFKDRAEALCEAQVGGIGAPPPPQ